jgi:pyruvate/2-oxoglutarate dehydrogenase complex dihydrolipoamide acyltransferase (E2) component
MKVVFTNDWFNGERRYRKGREEQDVPNEERDNLPKTAKIVDEEDFMPPYRQDDFVEEESLKDFDDSRIPPNFGDHYGMLSDAAAKMVAQFNLKAEDLVGSGKDGRITKFDVQDFIRARDRAESSVEKE